MDVETAAHSGAPEATEEGGSDGHLPGIREAGVGQIGPTGSQDGVNVHVWGGSLGGRGTIGGRVSVYGDQGGVLGRNVARRWQPVGHASQSRGVAVFRYIAFTGSESSG